MKEVTKRKNTSLHVSSNFESGNIGEFVQHSDDVLNVWLGVKGGEPKPLWFYFRVSNVRPDKKLTINIINASSALGNPLGWSVVKPVYSYDQKKWERIDTTFYDPIQQIFSFTIAPKQDPVYFAYCYPYTYTQLQQYLKTKEKNKYLKTEILTKSEENRDVYLLTITDFEVTKKKIGIWINAREHSGETPGSYALEGLIDFLLSNEPLCDKIRRKFVFKIVPMVDVDGVYNGFYGKDRPPIDFARDWVKFSRPQTLAIKREIEKWIKTNVKYSMFLDFHSPCLDEYHHVYIFHPQDCDEEYFLKQFEFLNLIEKNSLPSNKFAFNLIDLVKIYFKTGALGMIHVFEFGRYDPPMFNPPMPARIPIARQLLDYNVFSFMIEFSYHRKWPEGTMTQKDYRDLGITIARAIYDFFSDE